MKLSPGFSFVPSMPTEKDAPPTPPTALLWAQTSTVSPPVGPHSLSRSSASSQTGLSGHCLSVNAVSQHPATPCVEPSTPCRPCCGSRPQRQRCLISFPMRAKAAFAQQHRRQPPGSSSQVLETNEALVVSRMWNNHLVLRPICIPYKKGGWGMSGAAPDCKQPWFKGLRLWLCWITLRWMKSRWCFETSQKRRSRIPSRRFLIVMRQWVIYSV